jgi:unsaturated rhamnogalacturonyl hydrolase
MAVFLTLANVYEKTGEHSYLPWLDSWAEWAMYELPRTPVGGMQHITYLTENHNELWDDTLMMTVLPLAKIGKLLHRPHYIEEAKRQFLLHIKYLFDATRLLPVALVTISLVLAGREATAGSRL